VRAESFVPGQASFATQDNGFHKYEMLARTCSALFGHAPAEADATAG
jgi:hypothetical protein